MNATTKYVGLVVAAVITLGTQFPSYALDPTSEALVGHWRKTTIVFEQPRDEHLVLHANGAVENWTVTATSRTQPSMGAWRAEGKTLTLQMQGQTPVSRPFTFYEGQLVLPNIPNSRGFWKKIGN